MLYNEYYSKLIEEFNNRRDIFPNDFNIGNHRDGKYHLNNSYNGYKIHLVYSGNNSRAFGVGFIGFVVEVYLDGNNYEPKYNMLLTHKEEIESSFNSSLVWQSREETQNQNTCRIFIKKDGNIADREHWDEYINWQLEYLLKFISVFPRYIFNQNDAGGQNMNESNYRNWLRNTPTIQGNLLDENRINGRCRRLSQAIPDKLNEVDGTSDNRSLFNVEDINYLRQIKQRLNTGGDLYEWDYSSHGHGGCSAALNSYIKFLTERLEPEIIEPPQEETSNLKVKNIILYGSPGVGKTHNTKKLISLIERGKLEKEIFEVIKNNVENNGVYISDIKDRVKFITFHQSFGYEDYIEGFRPNENGDIKLQDGIFKTICDDANNDREKNYYLVIDEINRGNISKIFGELITLIEEDKRDTLEVTLPYSKKPFKIPSNLYIIGTMNSTDKSIALIDIALRRRFTFLKMEPNEDLVKYEKAKAIMQQLNEKITDTLGSDYVLGHSYFMKIKNDDDDDLDFVLEYKIKPLLEEYFYGDKNGYDEIMKVIDNI